MLSLRHANDPARVKRYTRRVTHSRPKRFTNWYFREWMGTAGVNQAAIVERTTLSKTAVSLLANDRQDYTPEIIRDIAAALNIAAHELLMHPKDAMAFRALRADAVRIVEREAALSDKGESTPRTGTNG